LDLDRSRREEAIAESSKELDSDQKALLKFVEKEGKKQRDKEEEV
jgi:hypothetical protein